jgi:hypothetical protein
MDGYDLISRFVLLKDNGQHSIEIGYLLNTDNKATVSIEPMLTSLRTVPTMDINFHFENNRLSMTANKHEVVFTFEVKF